MGRWHLWLKWTGTVACLALATLFIVSTNRGVEWTSPGLHYKVGVLAGAAGGAWRPPGWIKETDPYAGWSGWCIATYRGGRLTWWFNYQSHGRRRWFEFPLWIPSAILMLPTTLLWYRDRRKLSVRDFFGITFLALIGIQGGELLYWDPQFEYTPINGGLIAWGVCGLFVWRSRHPFGLLDASRCAGWMLLGCSLTLPSKVDFAVQTIGIVVALLGIVLASLFIKPREITGAGLCENCGYNLTGNISGICPECGTETAKASCAGGPVKIGGSE